MQRNENILILFFESRGHGEVALKIRSTREDLTMRHVRTEAERLLKTYRSKKGVRLKAFRRALLIRRENTILVQE